MEAYLVRPSDHHSDRQGERIRYIVVHSTAGPVGATSDNILRYLVHNDREVSVHVYVGEDGTCYQMVPDELAAHHCASATVKFADKTGGKWANRWTWGIELYQIVGQNVPEAAVQAGVRVVAEACARLGVPVERVVGHREIDPSRRTDPVGVDMDWFREQVRLALGERPGERAVLLELQGMLQEQYMQLGLQRARVEAMMAKVAETMRNGSS